MSAMTESAHRAGRRASRLAAIALVVAGLHGLVLMSLRPPDAWRPSATAPRAGLALTLLPPAPPLAPPAVARPVAAPSAKAVYRPARPPAAQPPAAESPPVIAAPESSPAAPAGDPPPVYPTTVPGPLRLRYAAQVNGVAAEADLEWAHDGQRYRLDLRVRGPTGNLVEQRSEGGFDAAGLAPERFVDRRRGRLVGAAHFRRDVGRISFSGPAIDYQAWPGSQDRLAWLPQFVAVLAAAPSPPAELRFFVADARGAAQAWVFRAAGSEAVAVDGGMVQALKYAREPPRLDDLRIGVWVDPAAGWWPVQIDWQVPISGWRTTLVRRSAGAPGS